MSDDTTHNDAEAQRANDYIDAAVDDPIVVGHAEAMAKHYPLEPDYPGNRREVWEHDATHGTMAWRAVDPEEPEESWIEIDEDHLMIDTDATGDDR